MPIRMAITGGSLVLVTLLAACGGDGNTAAPAPTSSAPVASAEAPVATAEAPAPAEKSWSEVFRWEARTTGDSEPFEVTGSDVRLRYNFGFEPVSPYVYGQVRFHSAEDGKCGQGLATGRSVQDEAKGVMENFEGAEEVRGPVCLGLWLPDAHFDRGTVTLIVEQAS